MQIHNIDRKIQPEFKTIDKINIIKAQKTTLNNNIPVYYINAGSQDLVKIEINFNAGSWFQTKNIVASATNSMLLEGTKNFTSHQIAEKLDFYGAYLQNDVNKHTGSLCLYVLNKYLKEGLEIVSDILENSIFPEKEFKTEIQNRFQSFRINRQKNSVLAKEKFSEVVFSKNHPYGNTYSEEDFKKISQKDVIEFYNKYYKFSNCRIFMSGKIEQKHFEELNKFFGTIKIDKCEQFIENEIDIVSETEKKYYQAKEDAFQTALRIGKPTINIYHKDFLGLQVVNAVLGGYFGSRLMSNIREDKGYTYGIGSVIGNLPKTGYFLIVTEVKKEIKDDAINQIYKEIERLQNELVPETELNIVKNYLMGEVLRNFDGAFSLVDIYKSLYENNLDYDYFDNLIYTIKNITTEEIQRLSKKYLQIDSLYEVAIG